MGSFYKFSSEAYWDRPDGGPLIIPIFSNMKTGSGKSLVLGIDYIECLRRLNPDDNGFKHIISPTYGPSRGLNKKGTKIRMVTAVYPGPDHENIVQISRLSPSGKWGMVVGLPEHKIPSKNYTHETHPHLIHRVYGSNHKGTSVLLEDVILVPVLSNGRWIQMKWLEKI